MLTVTNLSIHVKRTKETLVRSVSFSVENRETLGLIGESGSGKSMTSKCIMRLLNPRLFDMRGSVQWNGKEMLAVKLSGLGGYRGKQISMIPLYGDNVFEKDGIRRDRTGDGEKTRCLCGKRGIFNRDGPAMGPQIIRQLE